MIEIIKLYRLAGVKYTTKCSGLIHCEDCEHSEESNCYNKYYTPFTAEKQIELFKMFCNRYLEVSQFLKGNGDLCFGIKATVGDFAVGFNKDFAECLADFVNCLWQDLTKEERNKVRKILK